MCSRAVWLLLVVGLVQQPLFGPTPADAGFSLPIRIWKQIEREAKTAGYELRWDLNYGLQPLAAPYTTCDVARGGYEIGRLQERSLLERDRGSRSLLVVRAMKESTSTGLREDVPSVTADALELFSKNTRPALTKGKQYSFGCAVMPGCKTSSGGRATVLTCIFKTLSPTAPSAIPPNMTAATGRDEFTCIFIEKMP